MGVFQYPQVECFPIVLEAGDLLIRPSRAVHAPWKIKDCLISRTQHFHSSSMHNHMSAANFKRQYLNTTNEDEPREAVAEFSVILREMLKNNPRWPWPTEAEHPSSCTDSSCWHSSLATISFHLCRRFPPSSIKLTFSCYAFQVLHLASTLRRLPKVHIQNPSFQFIVLAGSNDLASTHFVRQLA